MASLKEIKVRIASIRSTQKITAAMKMVSSAKLHHTQTLTEHTPLCKQTFRHLKRSFRCGMRSGITLH